MFKELFSKSSNRSLPSEAHMLLLSKFINAHDPAQFRGEMWNQVLSEDVKTALGRLVSDKMLVSAATADAIVAAHSSQALRDMLKARGLKVSGTKPDLVARLVTSDPNGMAALAQKLKYLCCSAEAQVTAQAYVQSCREKQQRVMAESMSLLHSGHLEEALKLIWNYEAAQVFPRGAGVDWHRMDTKKELNFLKTILSIRPGILRDVPEAERRPLGIAAAMMHLWGQGKLPVPVPDGAVGSPKLGFETSARMIIFAASNERLMAAFKETGVKYVNISVVSDSCPTCQAFKGVKFSVSETPELPCPTCTHVFGCRCIPVVGEW
jgi:SAP domain